MKYNAVHFPPQAHKSIALFFPMFLSSVIYLLVDASNTPKDCFMYKLTTELNALQILYILTRFFWQSFSSDSILMGKDYGCKGTKYIGLN